MNNERSLAKEITEGFEALKSMRNNEPVAYRYEDKNNPLVFYFTTRKDKTENPDAIEIPLYAHPAKTLTDEEIEVLWEKHCPFDLTAGIDFARAILRKAQEK